MEGGDFCLHQPSRALTKTWQCKDRPGSAKVEALLGRGFRGSWLKFDAGETACQIGGRVRVQCHQK